jgi:osmotically-inducible protein OsmY
MKQKTFSLFLAVVFFTAFSFTACKGKDKENNTTTTTTPSTTAPEISTDDALQKGVTDATKDYPGVSATVSNGEVTLTGTIERDKLPNLMQSIQGLSPKKVNNNLIVK